MTRIAGLASNRGRNLRNLDDLAPGGAELAVVLTDVAGAPVLDAARDRGVPAEAVPPREDEGRRDHERRVLDALAPYDVDLVCLDGYMRVLSEAFLDPMPTTLNVHPSLLPSFPGTDAWGDALAAGASVTGSTVHVVTNAVDESGDVIEDAVDRGPIVTQEPVPVYADDDRERLKERVLYRGEFRAYPRAVKWFAEGRVAVDREAGVARVDGDDDGRFPARSVVAGDRVASLRYGENPHQDAALYADDPGGDPSVVGADQLNEGAKALSYNNYNDADAALALVTEFDRPAAAVIKHTDPAGCATADSLAAAYERALATDPKSAYGGIVALNRECGADAAALVTDSFKEVVVAPAYTDDALATLCESENLRVLAVGTGRDGSSVGGQSGADDGVNGAVLTDKNLVGGRLVQERDLASITAADLDVVTEREPTDEQVETMLFAWTAVKHATSNAICFATGTETVGLGVGQVSRVDAVKIAAMKADEDAEGKAASGAVMASDAFFPMPDGVEAAAEAGVEAVIQPGGSINDDEVVAAADDLGMAMAFTGRRCFRHD